MVTSLATKTIRVSYTMFAAKQNRSSTRLVFSDFNILGIFPKLLALIVVILSWSYAGVIMAAEEPEYTIIEQADEFELRAYAPRIIAQATVSGSMGQASNRGFQVIADYIFGNNSVSNGASEKISMTVPVTMEPQSEKISMTVPVSMKQSNGKWRVDFFMPSKYTMENLPKPNNSAVELIEIPANNYAAIRFSGRTTEAKTAKKTKQLLAWLKSKGLTPVGEPVLARYNSPVSLPFMRRNEVIVPYE
jgi:effector-binding domain-containing protein